MLIHMNLGEMQIAHQMGNSRWVSNRLAGVDNGRCDMSSANIEAIGVLGEMAFAKWNNIYFDMSLHTRQGGPDFYYRGKSWDIKSTKKMEGSLIASQKKTLADSQMYVLALVSECFVDFVGYAYAEELLRKENLWEIQKGKDPVYRLKQHQLHPFDESWPAKYVPADGAVVDMTLAEWIAQDAMNYPRAAKQPNPRQHEWQFE